MYLFHLATLGFAGYALYRFLFPKPPPPGYDIDKNLDDMYPNLSPEPSSEYNDHDECWDQVEEEWNAMTEDERKELLDQELDEYYGRDSDATELGKGMLLWAYLMGRSQGLKEKSD
jgi:hypothetical protein